MSCRELVELVTTYLDGGLSDRDRARFEAHIAACEHCTAYLEQIRDTIRLTGELVPEGLAPEMERDLLDAFRDWKAGGA
ncbi:anti-sigma factor [Baekduia soli]|uniref:Anti-sigma factor n=1 Tax=Baekduia soli TaxID=496014 RepID=A0A5B8UC26_9ACTN|nr:anti-sigma factor [Baekduia soli]